MMEKGMWRYVLFHGILRFGLVFGILGVLTNVLFVRDNLFIHIIISMLVSPIVVGIPWGVSMWIFLKKKLK